MHIQDSHIKPEYRQVILKVLHYISQNLSGDLSLETLAGIAFYSPFHFQKIFSAVVLESPKQYVMRLRLERAAHHLKVFPNLPVIEISIGCGFSSPSIFSRAFKNYYGVAAEDFRQMSLEDILSQSKQDKLKTKHFPLNDTSLWAKPNIDPMEQIADIHISPKPVVKVFQPQKIACIQTTLSYPENISFAFKSLMQWAIPNDLITPNVKYVGIWLDLPFYTSPDQCRYIAGIEIKNDIKTNKGVNVLNMSGGKYASFNMIGNLESTLNHLLALNHKYLDEMGYEISDIICYERFDECPANKPYERINRNLIVPIKARK